MFNYRITAPLVPIFLLLFLPALAAYPWQVPFGNGLALPFLTVLTILFCALRYPGLLWSPIVFTSGLMCDLFTRSPLGYWTLLFLLTLACARATTSIIESRGRPMGHVCTGITLILVCVSAWGLASAYQVAWQDFGGTIEGMGMALILLPVPALLLLGLEHSLILKNENDTKSYANRSQ